MCTAEVVGGEAAAEEGEAAAVERVVAVVEEGPPWDMSGEGVGDHRVAARAPRLVPVPRVPAPRVPDPILRRRTNS